MIRTAPALALLASLSAPALAQDPQPSPQPSPQPASQPSSQPVLDRIGALLVKAAREKVLAARFPAGHAYKLVLPKRRDEQIQAFLQVRSELAPTGDLTLELVKLDPGIGSERLRYRFAPSGALTQLETHYDTPRHRFSKAGKVVGAELVVTRSRDGKTTELRHAWRRDAIPTGLATFVLPALADQGLELPLSGPPLRERRIGEDHCYGKKPVSLLAAGEVSEGEVRCRVFELDYRRDPSEVRVYAEGPLAGQIHWIRAGQVSEPKTLFLRLAGEAAAKEQRAAALYNNEVAALHRIRSLHWSQLRAKNAKRVYSVLPEELGLQPGPELGYRILLGATPDGQRWMAVAAPVTPGKTGRRYFVTNHEGKTYTSDAAIALNERCRIPAGVEEVP